VDVLLIWGWFELRTAQPLVDLRTTARRQVLFTNLASAAFGFSMFAMSLVLPQLLQLPSATGYGLGRSMLTVGLVMAPMGLVMMAMAPLSAAISKARGAKTTLMLGAVIVAAGYLLNILMMSQIWQLVLVSGIIGAGVGFAYGAMPTLIMGAVPASESAAANSLNTLMRSIGTSIASAVAGVVLAQMTTTFGSTALPSENGFKTVMAVGAGAALLALGLAACLPAPADRRGDVDGDRDGPPGDGRPGSLASRCESSPNRLSRKEILMKSLLSSKPVLWFLFLFNLLVALVAGVGFHGSQAIVTSVGMGVVALGAGSALLRGRLQQT
jgi:MFS family permease